MNMQLLSLLLLAAGKGLPWWLWLLIILVVVLILLLIIWLLTRKKKTPAQPPAEAKPAEAPATAPAQAELPAIPEDLTVIEGIGPKVHTLLREAGIQTFAQLAATERSKLDEIVDRAGLRMMDVSTWAEQAKLAAEGKWEELKALQDSLKGGRKVG